MLFSVLILCRKPFMMSLTVLGDSGVLLSPSQSHLRQWCPGSNFTIPIHILYCLCLLTIDCACLAVAAYTHAHKTRTPDLSMVATCCPLVPPLPQANPTAPYV